jgi:two-component system sensor histidine kinase KdpD
VAGAERAEAFRQADELKAELISSLSHDLRTPLTTIKGLANRLAASAIPDAKSIEEEADRLTRLVTDLLDLSRLNARAMPVNAELNTVDDLVGAALKHFMATPSANRIDVVLPRDADSGVHVGRFDFVLSLRALVNLVENALKYSPETSRVEVGAQRCGNVIEISVADRGAGVAAAEVEHIFTPFYRSAPVAAHIGGTGLGLAIARRLALAQHGDVVHHARPGGGSVFCLELPAADVEVVPEAGLH